jgi:hypothetical protein
VPAKTLDLAPFVLDTESTQVRQSRRRIERKTQLELNRQARIQAKEIEKAKQAARNRKEPTCLHVTHYPTYSIVKHKRLDGKSEARSVRPTFHSKNEIQSNKSQSRLKNAINWMLLFASPKRVYSKKAFMNKVTRKMQHTFSFRLAFITLTLPDTQRHSDRFIKEHLLQPFLYWLTRYFDASYVWKAESQLNGNIHFHITIDTFIHHKIVRLKWNMLCEKYGYCFCFSDGTNDKGNASTQIKSVLSETKCAKDIGGYMSKKDRVNKKDLAAIKSKKPGYEDSNVHCKFNPDLGPAEQDRVYYKRVIDGRLWGCSENLSLVKLEVSEQDVFFKNEEKIFFRQNNNVYNLASKVINREKAKYAKVDPATRAVLLRTDQDIEQAYRFMENVYIHPHLSLMKKGGHLQKLIHELKLSSIRNSQTSFTVESLS